MLKLVKEALEEIKQAKKVAGKVTDKMTDKEYQRWKLVKAYIEENGELKNKDVQEVLAVSETTAKRFLKRMVEYQLLVSRGQNKERKYDLK